ncbi:aminomethyltransferase family protein [Desulfomarina sp.]
MKTEKKTVLHGFHLENGANMASFGGYDMPLWYPTGVKAEHLAVIRGAGVFDTSHMAVVMVRGNGARKLLQHCFTKDLERSVGRGKTPLVIGRCVYGVFLHPDGTVIDDAIVYQLGVKEYMVVVNAGMGPMIADHLLKVVDDDTQVEDLTDRVGKMDIQGIASARILKKILRDPQTLFDGMAYFSFKGGFGGFSAAVAETELLDGTRVLVSRTGYTGEFGFELFVKREELESLWNQLLVAGEEHGIIPCGLAARDSLRAGAVLPLSHQDIGSWPFLANPWQFALAWNEEQNGFSKDFIGADALLGETDLRYTYAFAGFDPRKIGSEASYVTDSEKNRIGTILTCTTDMAIGRQNGQIVSIAENRGEKSEKPFVPKGLSCGFVLLEKKCEAGEKIYLTDGKRKLKVEIRNDVRPGRTARLPIKTMI